MPIPPEPGGAPVPPDPFEPYLNRAASLFDLGDVVQAGQIWQAILKRNPNHAAARAGLYKVKVHFDSRATQDGLTVQPAPEPPPTSPAPPDPEQERLLEEGCALYDAGRTSEAMAAWEKVLERDPGNAMAKGYLEGARRRRMEQDAASTGSLAALPPEPPSPQPIPQSQPQPQEEPAEDPERLLRDGCTLFDMGQTADALRKWEQLLAIQPHHALALAYARDARKELGLPEGGAPLQEDVPSLPAFPSAPAAPVGEEGESPAEHLVRDGVQLYDMGMTDEAVERWERALSLDPAHANAAEYLRMAQRDREAAPPRTQAPPPPAAPSLLDEQIQEAEALFRAQRFDEAAKAFQHLLEAHPLDPRVQHGHQQARALLAAEAQRPAPILRREGASAPPRTVPAPVGPPRTLTARSAPPRQGGLKLKVPTSVKDVAVPGWLRTPRNAGIALGAAALLLTGLYLGWDRLRETALRQAVTSAKADAMKPVSRQLEVTTLADTPQALRQEAEAALGEDPLLAYYRSQEWMRLEPGNAAAAQLVDQAKARTAALPQAGDLAEFQKSVQAGDLEAAARTLRGLLAQTPDDPDLKAKARMVDLARAQQFASKEHYSDAKDCLLRVRAMYPQERVWQSRLKLLETLPALPKAERAGWIQMLG